jgi:hypothetical protein
MISEPRTDLGNERAGGHEAMRTPRYLTEELLRDVAATFEWPAPFEVDEDEPDGIMLCFAECTLYFSEYGDGDLELSLLPEDTGADLPLKLADFMLWKFPLADRVPGRPLVDGLIKDRSPWATEDKVRNGLHDLCLVAVTHLGPFILGDRSWVAEYRAMTRR